MQKGMSGVREEEERSRGDEEQEGGRVEKEGRREGGAKRDGVEEEYGPRPCTLHAPPHLPQPS